MIGFDTLGIIGRLGNQMFQYAALQGIAKHKGYQFMIPDHSMYHEYGGYNYHELQHCFKLHNLKHLGYIVGRGSRDKEYNVGSNQYRFKEEFFNACPDNHTIIGYFETEKYFLNAKKEVLDDYEFKDQIQETCKQYLRSLSIDKPVSLTVRRGDFLTQQNHRPICTLAYYKDGMSRIGIDRNYLIFSDDIQWCKEQSLFNKSNITFAETINYPIHKSYFDLCLISLCSDHIIANSTFCFWGSYLSKNENKRIIAPRNWFGPALPHDTKDLYCDTWEVI